LVRFLLKYVCFLGLCFLGLAGFASTSVDDNFQGHLLGATPIFFALSVLSESSSLEAFLLLSSRAAFVDWQGE
jgi:hypothetical protein